MIAMPGMIRGLVAGALISLALASEALAQGGSPGPAAVGQPRAAPSVAGPPLTGEAIQRREIDDSIAEIKQWLFADEQRDRRLDDDLVLIIEALAPSMLGAGGLAPAANWRQTAALLAAEGIDHPLVLLANARRLDQAEGRGSAREPYAAAVRGLVDANAPPNLIISAASLAAAWEDRRQVERALPYHILRRDTYLRHAESEASSRPGQAPPSAGKLQELTTIGVRMVESLPVDVAVELATRLGAMSGVDECLRETVRGALEKRIAWDERGIGFANTVDGRQWKSFGERLGKAYTHLKRAWLADPRRPAAPTELIAVAMAGGTPPDEDEHVWFTRATEAQFDHWPAYTFMLWALRPRWGGSHEEMEAFGRRALEGGRFDSHVPLAYVDALRGILQDGAGLRWLARAGVRERIEALAKGYEASGISTWRAQTNTWRLLAAVAAGDHAAAAAIIDDPKFSFDTSILYDLRIVPAGIFNDVLGLSGAHGAAIAEADKTRFAGRPAEAAKSYENVLAQLEAEGAAIDRCDAIRDRIATATIATGLAGGEWTEIGFEPGLFGWRQNLGTWAAESKRGVAGSGRDAPLRLACTVDPGFRFEVRATLSVLAMGSERAEAAILFNHVDVAGAMNYRCVSWYPKRGRLEIAGYGSEEASIVVPVPSEGKKQPTSVALHIQVWDDEIAVLIGDKLLHVGPLPETDSSLGGGLALGTRFDPPSSTTVHVRDVAVRRLGERPKVFDGAASGGMK